MRKEYRLKYDDYDGFYKCRGQRVICISAVEKLWDVDSIGDTPTLVISDKPNPRGDCTEIILCPDMFCFDHPILGENRYLLGAFRRILKIGKNYCWPEV